MYVVAKKKKWMQEAAPKGKKKGLLHRKLNVPEGETIPKSKIQSEISKLQKKRDARKDKKFTEDELTYFRQLQYAMRGHSGSKKKKSEVMELIIKTANSLDEMGLSKEADVLDVILDYVTAGPVDEGIERMESLPGYGPVADVARAVLPGQEEKSEDPLKGTKKDLGIIGDVAKVLLTTRLPKPSCKECGSKCKCTPEKSCKCQTCKKKIAGDFPRPNETNYPSGSGDTPESASRDNLFGKEVGKVMAATNIPGQPGQPGAQPAGSQQPGGQQQGQQPGGQQGGQEKKCQCGQSFTSSDPNQTKCDKCMGKQPQGSAPAAQAEGQGGKAATQ